MKIQEMTIAYYDAVMELMQNTPGMRVRSADSKEATARYLARNPGLSFIAVEDNKIVVGCAMCGHDGRRGYLQHVVVLPEYRRQGIATKLIDRCLSRLETLGIFKTHIDVLVDNQLAHNYWIKQGW